MAACYVYGREATGRCRLLCNAKNSADLGTIAVFTVAMAGELAFEIDPRTVSSATLAQFGIQVPA